MKGAGAAGALSTASGEQRDSAAMTAAVAVAVLALAIVLVMPLAAAESFQVGTCAAASEYFDTPSISCKQCHVGAVADASRVPDTSSLDVLGYAPKCVCPEGYRTSDIACDVTSPTVCGPPECASCIASGQAVSRDHTRCMPCGSTTNGLDVALGDCTCPANHALVETTVTGVALASKECEPCPATHRVFSTASAGFLADRYTCQTCPGALVVFVTPTPRCMHCSRDTVCGRSEPRV